MTRELAELAARAGFCATALGYLVLLVLLLSRQRGAGAGRVLLLASGCEIAWCAANVATLSGLPQASTLALLADAFRIAAWIGFVLGLISQTALNASQHAQQQLARALKTAFAAVLAGCALLVLVARAGFEPKVYFTCQLLLGVGALVAIEQLWRNTPTERRWSIKFLCLALLFKFGFSSLLFSDALLYSRVDSEWWVVRALADLLLIPLIAVSAARNPRWKLDVGISRTVVFHSATLLVTGTVLVMIALAGYYIRFVGGSWGGIVATLVVLAALVALLMVAASGHFRSHARVFLSKHFFSLRFDYRREWLKLSELMASHDDRAQPAQGGDGETADLAARALAGLAGLVDSPAGSLYLKDAQGTFGREIHRNYPDSPSTLALDDALVERMGKRDWIVVADDPNQPAPAWMSADRNAWVLVPLTLDHALIGAVLLARPLAAESVDWEVRDILKAAARQVASYLAIRQAVEALVQARQFDSFTRMSAFVVHDLKNLVLQLRLLLENSARHQGNPRFHEAVLGTVGNVAGRMESLLLQLRVGTRPVEAPSAVPVEQAIRNAVAAKGPLKPAPVIEIREGTRGATVCAHPERLERVLGHLIQNATEATPADGDVVIRSMTEGHDAVIEVSDTGMGMTEDFVRTRLFKPYSTTKAHGMGIGVFESREYISEIGGSVSVSSVIDVGTTFRIRLPIRSAG